MCNRKYTPGAKNAYIARITGRDSKMTFAREFIGAERADVDTPGLYETRDVDKKGHGETPEYWLLLPIDGDDVQCVETDKETAMKIAKALDAGRKFDTIVDEHGDLVTPRQAEQRAAAQTIDAAVAACWEVIKELSQKDLKKVIAQLRLMATPKETVAPLASDAPVGIVLDAAQEAGVPLPETGLGPCPVAMFAAGDNVVCDDDQDGANFLFAGQQYEVTLLQTNDAGQQRVCLAGMARAWEASRFHKA